MHDDPVLVLNPYDEDDQMFLIENAHIEAEFRMATQQAVDSNHVEFDFMGYVVEVDDALELLAEIASMRTYH